MQRTHTYSLASCLLSYLQKLKEQGKGVVFVGSSFIYGLLGNAELVPKIGELEAFLQQVGIESAEEDRQRALKKLSKEAQQEQKSKEEAEASSSSSSSSAKPAAAPVKAKQLVRVKDTVAIKTKKVVDKKPVVVNEKVTGLVEFVVFTYEGHQEKVVDFFRRQGFATSEAL